MPMKKSVVSAIAAAVQMYIQSEQQMAAPVKETSICQPPGPAYSPWSLAGRQAAMEFRRLWQMRLAR
jgi:hypothetical protein